jgi:hypothetical protein
MIPQYIASSPFGDDVFSHLINNIKRIHYMTSAEHTSLCANLKLGNEIVIKRHGSYVIGIYWFNDENVHQIHTVGGVDSTSITRANFFKQKRNSTCNFCTNIDLHEICCLNDGSVVFPATVTIWL